MSAPPAPPQPVRHLYLHVPFCARKCEYCAFYSEPVAGELGDRFIAALIRELEFVADELQPATVFVGGGTPTLLTFKQWDALFHALRRCLPQAPAEWTVEANPATLSLDKARFLRENGVNRISLGVQSLEDTLLDRLGRVHSRDMVFRSFDALRRAGFDNVNVDLMFAIPGQSLDQWRATLREALALGSEHLSCYEVIYEEDTPLFAQLQAGEVDVDDDLAAAMYEVFREAAEAHGLVQYEVANFARHRAPTPGLVPSFSCRHNVNYWRGGPYHGLGPSASGFTRGVRTRNWANTRLYCERLEAGQRPIESTDRLSPIGRAGEIAAFGLRMNCGWPFADFTAVTGFDLRQEWAADLQALVDCGWGEQSPEAFRLTRSGLRFADAAALRLLRSPNS